MVIPDYEPSRVRLTFGGVPVFTPASDKRVTNGDPPKAFTITLKPDSDGAKSLSELLRPGSRLPLPLVLRTRDRPKRRRHARGGLRRMVRARRALVMHGVCASGGVDKPWTITAECVTSKRYDDAKKFLAEHIRKGRAEPGSEVPVDAPVLIDEHDTAVFKAGRRANEVFLRDTLGLQAVYRDGVVSYEPLP